MSARWRNALGIALSLALLVWTLWGIDPAVIWANLRGANLWYFAGASICGTLIVPLRARRWRIILDPIAPGLPFGLLWRATAIGVMGNNVLPARAGEFARAFALSRETSKVSFAAAFASLAVDRVFDAFVVLLLMLAAMMSPSFPDLPLGGRHVSDYVVGGAIVSCAALAALYLIVFFPQPILTLYEWLVRRVAPRFEARGREALIAFTSGLGVLRHPARFAAVLLWTLAHWLLNGVAFLLAFKAVGIAAPFGAALLVQGLIAIGVAVPSAPGFFGVFEKLGQLGLGLYGVDKALATSWAIGFHLLTYIPITIIGGYYFVHLGLHFRDFQRVEQRAERDTP
jgi:glycosyltransferase 2 family protein